MHLQPICVLTIPRQSARIQNGVEYLYEAARALPRVIGTFVDYDTVLVEGLIKDGKFSDADPDCTSHSEFNKYREVRVYYKYLKEAMPGLADHTPYLRRHPDFVGQLSKWAIAGKARSDDLTRLLKEIYLLAEMPRELLDKPRRGFQHPFTGRLLCPVKMLPQFDADPEKFCREVRNMTPARLPITGCDYPMFLYDMKLYVPGKAKPGFMKGGLLLQASSSAGRGRTKPKGKPPLSRKLPGFEDGSDFGIMTIIYVAALLRFALNSQGEWCADNGDFEGLRFTRSILTIFLRDDNYLDEIEEWYKL
ncbi:hypothetical protein BV20DRAFT_953298 [Pilatotrama ljubarskyi]|nr:hypothetical protein BV20DRAFT_953298 [Pilatotrama ljubarskyi]